MINKHRTHCWNFKEQLYKNTVKRVWEKVSREKRRTLSEFLFGYFATITNQVHGFLNEMSSLLFFVKGPPHCSGSTVMPYVAVQILPDLKVVLTQIFLSKVCRHCPIFITRKMQFGCSREWLGWRAAFTLWKFKGYIWGIHEQAGYGKSFEVRCYQFSEVMTQITICSQIRQKGSTKGSFHRLRVSVHACMCAYMRVFVYVIRAPRRLWMKHGACSYSRRGSNNS